MPFELERTDAAAGQLAALEADAGLHRQLKAVRKALGLLQQDPNYRGLNVHSVKGAVCPHGDTLFEAYAQNNTPGAYRIFFCYPPNSRGRILIIAITPHP
ncbi:MAG: hypothetical protein ABUL62_19355 [Myxococcales bacterium]